jgi:hypothetical protein
MIDNARELVAEILSELGASAAGLWRIDGERLVQVAFAASTELDEAVARDFEEATRSISLDRTNLGVVIAVRSGKIVPLHSGEIPDDAGSGLWLNRFRAARSVAMPIADAEGKIIGGLAASFASMTPDDQTVGSRLRELASAAGLRSAAP